MLEKHGEADGGFLEVMMVELEVGFSQWGGNGVNKSTNLYDIVESPSNSDSGKNA